MPLPVSRPSARPFSHERGGVFVKLLLFLLIFAALLSLAWMAFLPLAVTHFIASRTGFPVSVESLSVNPFTAKVHVRGLVIENPAAFASKDFVTIRELRVDADLFSLARDKVLVDEAVFDVAELCLAKDRGGKTNALLFKERLLGLPSGGPETRPSAPSQTAEAGRKNREFLIRRLELRFDKLALADWDGQKPRVAEYDIAFRHSYENVSTPIQIAVPIVVKFSTLGGNIGDFAGKLGAQSLDSLKKTGETLKDAGKKAGESLKGFFQSLKEKTKK
jgi:hypothetical protein